MEIKEIALEMKVKVNDNDFTIEDWGLSPQGSRVFTIHKEGGDIWFTLYVSNQKNRVTIRMKKDNKIKKYIMKPGTEGTRLKDIFKKAFEMVK